jgi:hypothetical protein
MMLGVKEWLVNRVEYRCAVRNTREKQIGTTALTEFFRNMPRFLINVFIDIIKQFELVYG